MKPPFTYFGGKTALAARIAALLPRHEHYVEPFAGSLAVLLAKQPSPMETVNDLDRALVTFWRVLRERPGDLERMCALTPHARVELDQAREPAGDDLETARRVWVRLTQERGSQLGRRGGWRFYEDPRGRSASMPVYLAGYTSRIPPAAQRLARVSLECRPALDVIAAYGKHASVLLYVDPPYPGSVRAWDRGPVYTHEMRDDESHRALARALMACRSAVLLSGYASELYDGLFGDWRRTEVSAFTGNGRNQERTEVLWSNRPFPQAHPGLFDDLEAS
ncbi:MAG: class adenine-specific methyltransferase [Streptosporangiaceae bacterium]|nr:class adenine-specific methyltransferase [Streptosporangiaceae bacterium]